MDATSVVIIVASFVWILPAVALVLLYLDEAFDVPIASRIGGFCRQMIGEAGSRVELPVRSEEVVRYEALPYRPVPGEMKAGKNLHAQVENTTPVGVNSAAFAHRAVASAERNTGGEGFVAIEAVWKRKDDVIEVERWMLGVN